MHEELFLSLKEALAKEDIDFDETKLKQCLVLLPETLLNQNSIQIIVSKLITLKKIFDRIKEDDVVKRTAAKILHTFFELKIFNLLLDNSNFFTTYVTQKIDSAECFSLCEKAALLASQKIFDILVNQLTSPINPYIIVHAICSSEHEWLLRLLDKYNIDILDNNYLFDLYAHIIGDEYLLNYYDKQKESAPSISANVSNLAKTTSLWNQQGKSSVIPDDVLRIVDDLIQLNFDCLIQNQHRCNQLLHLLLNNNYSLKEILFFVEQLDPDFSATNGMTFLCCCLHPEFWKEPLIANFAQLSLTNFIDIGLTTNTGQERDLKVERLKKYATQKINQLIKNFLKINAREIRLSKTQVDQINNMRKINSEDFEEYISNFTLLNDILNVKEFLYKENISELLKSGTGNKNNCPKILRLIKAIVYQQDNQLRWCDLPQSFPPYAAIFYCQSEWQRRGILHEIVEAYKKNQSHISQDYLLHRVGCKNDN